MKLPELIFELLKAGFTIENTTCTDINVTTLTRDTDNALVRTYSIDSDSVFAIALFPDRNLPLPIIIKSALLRLRTNLDHEQIDNILTTFADRIHAARSTNKHFFLESDNCTCFGSPGCNICDGGLALCPLCGHIEGSLTTDCPATPTYATYGDLVYAGTIDFRKGAWVKGISSPYSPAHYRESSQSI